MVDTRGIVCQTKASPLPPISDGAVVLAMKVDQEENRGVVEVNDIDTETRRKAKMLGAPLRSDATV